MPSSGPLSPSTVVDDSSIGTVSWTNPGNAGASDNSYTTAAGLTSSVPSHYLKATQFGFAIPTAAVIDGVVVEVEVSGDSRLSNNSVKLVKGGTISGTDRAGDASYPSSGESYMTFGSSTELWGLTWTATDINATTFGVVYGAVGATGTAKTSSVDHIRITVYYTTNNAPTVSSAPSVGYGAGNNAVGPNNSATVTFTAQDADAGDQGANALTYEVRTGTAGTGTLIETGTCTHNVSKEITLTNAEITTLAQGDNTLYLSILDDESARSADSSFTLRRDSVAPTVNFDLHTPNPVTGTTYTVQYDGTDATTTGTNDMDYQIRTASGGGGTLLQSGTFTQGFNRTTATVTDTGLVDGSNTRYLRILDGALNVAETSFTVTADYVIDELTGSDTILAVDSGTNTLDWSELSGSDVILVASSGSETVNIYETGGLDTLLFFDSGTDQLVYIELTGLDILLVVDSGGDTVEFLDTGGLDILLAVDSGTETVNLLELSGSDVILITESGFDNIGFLEVTGSDVILVVDTGTDTEDISEVTGSDVLLLVDSGTDLISILETSGLDVLLVTESGTESLFVSELSGLDTLLVIESGSDYTEFVDTSGLDTVLVVDSGSETVEIYDLTGVDVILVVESGFEGTGIVDTSGLDTVLVVESGTDWFLLIPSNPITISFLSSLIPEDLTLHTSNPYSVYFSNRNPYRIQLITE